MDFGGALTALKAGKRVTRAGWNGQGMWVALAKSGSAWAPAMQGTPVRLTDFAVMHNAGGKMVVWDPSQFDLLQDDWVVVEV